MYILKFDIKSPVAPVCSDDQLKQVCGRSFTVDCPKTNDCNQKFSFLDASSRKIWTPTVSFRSNKLYLDNAPINLTYVTLTTDSGTGNLHRIYDLNADGKLAQIVID